MKTMMLPLIGFCRHIKPLLLKGGRIGHREKLSGGITAFGCEVRSPLRRITEPRIDDVIGGGCLPKEDLESRIQQAT